MTGRMAPPWGEPDAWEQTAEAIEEANDDRRAVGDGATRQANLARPGAPTAAEQETGPNPETAQACPPHDWVHLRPVSYVNAHGTWGDEFYCRRCLTKRQVRR